MPIKKLWYGTWGMILHNIDGAMKAHYLSKIYSRLKFKLKIIHLARHLDKLNLLGLSTAESPKRHNLRSNIQPDTVYYPKNVLVISCEETLLFASNPTFLVAESL